MTAGGRMPVGGILPTRRPLSRGGPRRRLSDGSRRACGYGDLDDRRNRRHLELLPDGSHRLVLGRPGVQLALPRRLVRVLAGWFADLGSGAEQTHPDCHVAEATRAVILAVARLSVVIRVLLGWGWWA